MGRLSSCEWGVGEENNDKSPMSKVTMKMGAMGGRLLGGGLKCRGGGSSNAGGVQLKCGGHLMGIHLRVTYWVGSHLMGGSFHGGGG
jgi:hypothetical protein